MKDKGRLILNKFVKDMTGYWENYPKPVMPEDDRISTFDEYLDYIKD